MPLKLKVTITHSKGLDKNLATDLMQAVDRGLEEAAEQLMDISKTQFHRFVYPPIDTGQLYNSAKIDSEYLKKYIYYDCDYAAYVEYGTGPHMPPFDPIFQWVWRHKGAFKLPTHIKKMDSRIAAIAKRIQYKIAKHGTDAKPFLRPAFHIVKFRLKHIIKKHVKSFLKTLKVAK